MATLSATLVEFATINNESIWPMTKSLFGAAAFLGSPLAGNSWTSAGLGKKPWSVGGTSLVETWRTKKSTLRIFSVRIGLPASTHFFLRSARLVLS